MGRTIYLTESQVERLALLLQEAQEKEVTYYQFKYPCVHFIESLLRDPNPSRAQFEQVFTDNGITKEQLEKCLRKHSILSSKQRIEDQQGDKAAHYVRRYFRNSENLEAKLKEVYNELFGKGDQLSECTSCGATSCAGVGAGNGLDFPAFTTVRRTFATHKRKKKKKRNE